MFSWLKRQHELPGLVGIQIQPDGVSWARVLSSAEGLPDLTHCEYLECAGAGQGELLVEQLKQLGLQGSYCNYLLSPDDYQLLMIEAPKVPKEELNAAVQWKIKDLINFPVEDAVIDTIELPDETARGGQKMVYVIVSQVDKIERVIASTEQAGLKLQSIDVPDLILRNLAGLVSEDNRSTAIVWLGSGYGILQLCKNGSLYLSRRFDIAYDGGLLTDLPSDALILEIQRSLDYFDRQMGQVPPNVVYLCGEHVTADKITDEMNNEFSRDLAYLDLMALLPEGHAHSEQNLQRSLLAIGAALREADGHE